MKKSSLLAFACLSTLAAASGPGPSPLVGWTERIDGLGHGYDSFQALSPTLDGGFYAAGTSYGGSSIGNEWSVSRFGAGGSVAWTRRINWSNEAPQSDYTGVENVYAAATDGQGNLWLTGGVWITGKGQCWPIVEYGPDGTLKMRRVIDNPTGFQYNAGTSLIATPTGDVLVGGNSFAGNIGSGRIVCYSPSGVRKWERTYIVPGTNFNGVRRLALAKNGDILMAGYGYINGGSTMAATAWRLTPTGSNVWSHVADKQGDSVEIMESPNGDILHLSQVVNASSSGDVAVTCHAGTGRGAVRWEREYDSGQGYDSALEMTVLANGDVLATGRYVDSSSIPSIFTERWTSVGVAQPTGAWSPGGYSTRPGLYPSATGFTLLTTSWLGPNYYGRATAVETDPITGWGNYTLATVPGRAYTAIHQTVRLSDGRFAFVGDCGDDNGPGIDMLAGIFITQAWTYDYATPKNTRLTVTADAGAAQSCPPNMRSKLAFPPMHGAVSVGSDGRFTYTPERNFVGYDEFVVNVAGSAYDAPTILILIKVG